MKTVSGVYTSAKIFTDTIEDYALAQIQMLCDNEAFKECRVRVMPDVHPGKAGTIGFTSTIAKRVLPSVVGIDMGCGITIARLKQKRWNSKDWIRSSGRMSLQDSISGKSFIDSTRCSHSGN